ncbi:MAG: hypothetical protein RLZZ591_2575 [Pseudomonadota bacterium]|jgi:plasmid stability protein
MEQEVRNILQHSLAEEPGTANGLSFAQRINQRFKGLGGAELAVPSRQTARPLPTFDKP